VQANVYLPSLYGKIRPCQVGDLSVKKPTVWNNEQIADLQFSGSGTPAQFSAMRNQSLPPTAPVGRCKAHIKCQKRKKGSRQRDSLWFFAMLTRRLPVKRVKEFPPAAEVVSKEVIQPPLNRRLLRTMSQMTPICRDCG